MIDVAEDLEGPRPSKGPPTDEERFKFATNKDRGKTIMNKVHQSADFSRIITHGSDYSVDFNQQMTSGQTGEAEPDTDDEFEKELRETLAEVEADIVNSDRKAEILNVLSAYSLESLKQIGDGSHQGDLFPDWEESAMDLIAENDADRRKFLEARHISRLKKTEPSEPEKAASANVNSLSQSKPQENEGNPIDEAQWYQSIMREAGRWGFGILMWWNSNTTWGQLWGLFAFWLLIFGLFTSFLLNAIPKGIRGEATNCRQVIPEALRGFFRWLTGYCIAFPHQGTDWILGKIRPGGSGEKENEETTESPQVGDLPQTGENPIDRKQAYLRLITHRLTALGPRRKRAKGLYARDLYNHMIKEAVEDEDLRALAEIHVGEIRAHTPLFGRRPYCEMIVNGRNAKLLFDTGAQLCTFNKEFLGKLEDDLNKPLKVMGELLVNGYVGQTRQTLKQVTMQCPGYEAKTEVSALVNLHGENTYDGILGTAVMGTFRMGIYWPDKGHDVIITHRPKPGAKEQPLKAIITEEDDLSPVGVHEIHQPIRKSTRHRVNTVVIEEMLTAVPGKSMELIARVTNFSRHVKNSFKGMSFEPYEGFADFLLPAKYPTAPRLKIIVQAVGDLRKSDEPRDQEAVNALLANGEDATNYLPKNWGPGTVIGEVRPYEKTTEVQVNTLLKECLSLEGMIERECVCDYYAKENQQKYTVVLLGDKNGFNYSNNHQYLQPGDGVQKTLQASGWSLHKNVIAFKRHGEDDRYDMNVVKLSPSLNQKVVVLTSFREIITPGKLRAINDLKQMAGDVVVVRHQSEHCKNCCTLACMKTEKGNPNYLLSNFNRIDITYSADGTIPEEGTHKKEADLGEYRFRIKGVALIQAYRLYGNIKLKIHMKDTSSKIMMHEVNQLTYAQAYLFHQFKILRVPRNIHMFVSWPVDTNTNDPRNQVVSCMAGLDLWEEDPEKWGPVRFSGNLRDVNPTLRDCECKTCKHIRVNKEKVPVGVFRRVFRDDPLELAQNTKVKLNFPEGFSTKLNEKRRLGEMAGEILTIKSHRALLTSAMLKERSLNHSKLVAAIGELKKQDPEEEFCQVIGNMQKIDHMIATREAREKDSWPTHKEVNRAAPAPALRAQVDLKAPMSQLEKDLITLQGKATGPRAEALKQDTEVPVPPGIKRLLPPPAGLAEALLAADEDLGSDTSTDREVEKHVNEHAGAFDHQSIIGQRHLLDDPWRKYWDESRSPKNPKTREQFERLMDKHNNELAKHKDAWRLMNIEPRKIPFDPNAEPIVHQYIPMNPVEDFVLTKKVDELVHNDLLRVVVPDQGVFRNITRLFLVKHNTKSGLILDKLDKADLDEIDTTLYRVVADFRAVNNTILNGGYADYVMGTPQEVVARLGGSRYFISLDLKAAYRSIPVDEATRNRMMLRADTRLYRNSLLEFQSLVDGISVAPQIFTQVILDAVHAYLNNIVVWIDDITIHADTAEEALNIMDGVMTELGKIGALVALDKMQLTLDFDENKETEPQVFSHMGFDIKTANHWDENLGKWVCTPMLCISQTKRQLFGSMTCPTSYREVQKRLGCANWISHFLKNHQVNMDIFIQQLTKGADKKWVVTEEMSKAWRKLLHAINNAPDLSIIDYTRTLHIISDASLKGCGAQMHQNVNGKVNLLGYYSKRFKLRWGTHNKYSSVFREVLGLDYACQHWKRYIYACVKTVLTVDIASVVHMASSRFIQDDSHLCRLMSRVTNLGTSYQLRHRPAKCSPIPDTLSRLGGRRGPENQGPSTGEHSEVEQDAEGDWEMEATGVPISHLALTQDFLDKIPLGLPASWLSEQTEITMEDMMAHICEQIANDETLSPTQSTSKYKHLLQSCHEQFKPIVREWQLRTGAPDLDNDRVGTLKLKEKDKVVGRVACVKLTPDQRSRLDCWDEMNNKSGRVNNIDYRYYEEQDQATSMRNFDRGFLVRLQDKDPEVRRIKTEILNSSVDELDENHTHFRLENNQLLVTCRKDELGFNEKSNRRIYLGEWESLYVISHLHLVSGHMGLRGTQAFFSNYFDTGSITAVVDIVSQSCAACTMYNPIRAKAAKGGRLPRPLDIGYKAYIDVAKIESGYVADPQLTDRRVKDQEKQVDHILVIQEAYSGRVSIQPIKGQTAEVVAEAVKMYQCTNIPICTVHSDNATDFTAKEFVDKLRKYGVTGLSYSTPNSSTSNARVERYIRSLRAVAWKMAQHNHSSSLWHVIFEANAALNRRPCWELNKYLDRPGLPPSRDDIYYGLTPRNMEFNLEAVLGTLPLEERTLQREEYTNLIDAYNHDMNALLEERNVTQPITHEIKVGDYVLKTDIRRLKNDSTARGIPRYGRTIFRVKEISHDMQTKLEVALGGARRTRTARLSQLRKVASPHAFRYMPEDVRQSYGTPFTQQDIEEMTELPPQFMEALGKTKKDAPKTRSRRQDRYRKKREQIRGYHLVEEDPEDSLLTGSESQTENEEEDESLNEKVYEIDFWDTPTEDVRDKSDPRLIPKGKYLGDNKELLVKYFKQNGDLDAEAKAEGLWNARTHAPEEASKPRGILMSDPWPLKGKGKAKRKRVRFLDNDGADISIISPVKPKRRKNEVASQISFNSRVLVLTPQVLVEGGHNNMRNL